MINIIKGLIIGIANIIPGVSGGSFALILGIYTRLIDSISKLNFNILIPSKFKYEFKRIDGIFLMQIFAGAAIAIVSLAWIMDYLLKYQPAPTLSFFAGLIAASIVIPYDMIEKKKIKNLIYILPGFLAVVFIYRFWSTVPGGQLSLLKIFVSAAIGISAMILPGLSGSFILLILGVYQPVIGHIKNLSSGAGYYSYAVLAVFGMGCLAGLLIFVRAMKYLLHKKRDKTLSFLTGLVAGSFVVLWPFKDYPPAAAASDTDIAIITARNILPRSPGVLLYCILFFVAGLAAARGIKLLEKPVDN